MFRAPKPIWETPNSDSWGLITCSTNSLDLHHQYWFESPYNAIGFLCLGAEEYLPVHEMEASIADRKARAKAIERLLTPTIAAFQTERETTIATATDAVTAHWTPGLELAFFGQFLELASGKNPFAVRLRSAYFDERHFIVQPCEVSSADAEHFANWVGEFQGFLGPWVDGRNATNSGVADQGGIWLRAE